MLNLQHQIQTAMAHNKLAPLSWPNIVEPASLASWFDVAAFASATFGAASAALVRYVESFGHPVTQHQLNQRLVNLWFGFTLAPINFNIPPAWDDIAGDYPTQDGWIRLHTNATHHKQAALLALGIKPGAVLQRDTIAQAVKTWRSANLEHAVVEHGGCAAQMFSLEQWQHHEQGQHVTKAPLIYWSSHIGTGKKVTICNPKRPLQGIKILDLTRVLAGPVASRLLAGFGAQVLRIDPPSWEEPSLVAEVTLGKRCAALDLKTESGKAQLRKLIASADVILHGYRTSALLQLGFSDQQLTQLNPNLINVCLNAYGWEGPWRDRRGFDSLVQMSSGIAQYGMQQSNAGKPVPLPVQALDHGTGYLLAAAVIQSLELRTHHGVVSSAKMSLARTANLLIPTQRTVIADAMPPANANDYSPQVETTAWGEARRIAFPLNTSPMVPSWPNGAVALKSHRPEW